MEFPFDVEAIQMRTCLKISTFGVMSITRLSDNLL